MARTTPKRTRPTHPWRSCRWRVARPAARRDDQAYLADSSSVPHGGSRRTGDLGTNLARDQLVPAPVRRVASTPFEGKRHLSELLRCDRATGRLRLSATASGQPDRAHALERAIAEEGTLNLNALELCRARKSALGALLKHMAKALPKNATMMARQRQPEELLASEEYPPFTTVLLQWLLRKRQGEGRETMERRAGRRRRQRPERGRVAPGGSGAVDRP